MTNLGCWRFSLGSNWSFLSDSRWRFLPGANTAKQVYAYYGNALQVLNIIYGVCLIGFAILAIILRRKLASYKPDAPKYVFIFFSLFASVPFLYSSIASTITGEDMFAKAAGQLIIGLIFLFLNVKYFEKRRYLFTEQRQYILASSHDIPIGTNEISLSEEYIDPGKYVGNGTCGADIEHIANDTPPEFIYTHPATQSPTPEASDAATDEEQPAMAEEESTFTTTPQNKKIKYCSRCGHLIDPETKQCTGCGKQYFNFKGLPWKKAINVAAAILLVTFLTVAIVQTARLNTLDQKYSFLELEIVDLERTIISLQQGNSALQSAVDQYKDQIDFFDRCVVFIEDDGTNLYHKYECDQFKGNSFWALNVEAAKGRGYSPCSKCHYNSFTTHQ